MKLLVIVLNYRTAAMTIEALHAVVRELRTLESARVVVVENGSGDDSLSALEAEVAKEGWGALVSIVASERNRGFSGGVNFALRPTLAGADRPEYVYLLNSDAFVEPGAVAVLLDFLERHPGAGICGSYVHGTEGDPHETAFRFPTIIGEFIARVPLWPFTRLLRRFTIALPIPTEAQPVDWLAGASMMIRREVFDAIGLYDENFFFYFEETDFCLRAARAGFGTWYVPESRVEHIGAASSGWKDRSKPRAAFWWDGRRYYFYKNHGLLYLWLANAAWLAGYLLGETRRLLAGRKGPFPPRFFRDFLRYNLAFRHLGRGLPADP